MAVWEDLLIGEGFWLGLVIILCILYITSVVARGFGYIGGIICIFMIFYYLENLASNELKMWGLLIMAFSSAMMFLTAKGDS